MLSEFGQMLEGLQEALLNHILGIFSIARDVFSNSEEFAIVSPYDLLKGRQIPILGGMDKVEIVCRCSSFEFCRVVSHIHSDQRMHRP
jgi:hypothetical protein